MLKYKRGQLAKRAREAARAAELEPYMRGPRAKLGSVQTYLRDERPMMKLLKKFVPAKSVHSLPSRPGLLIRSGFGRAPFLRIMKDDRIWKASPEAMKAKSVIIRIYRKWKDKDMWHYD